MKQKLLLISLILSLVLMGFASSNVTASSGIAAYYVGPGETYMATLDGRVRKITNATSYTLFVPVRTLTEQQSFLNNLPAGVTALTNACEWETTAILWGTEYPIVGIGSQCWMAKNIAYLPSVVGPGTGSETISYYYVYGYNGTDVSAAKATSNYTTYGVLYNWTAANTACPSGWHLPTDAEFTTLTNTTNSKEALISAGWFNNLFAGYRGTSGSFIYLGSDADFWSSSASSSSNAWSRYLHTSYSSVYRYNDNKAFGFSVRCLRD
jgi:uncharacterized protein (TIGR02145 family)